MFELRPVQHHLNLDMTIIEVWDGNILRGVIHPTKTGVKVVSPFLLLEPSNRICPEPNGKDSSVSINLSFDPYFPGQKPAPCGHFYPDVIRVQDVSRGKRKCERHYYCCVCGNYCAPINKEAYSPQKPTEEELEKMMTEGWRMSERARIHKERHE